MRFSLKAASPMPRSAVSKQLKHNITHDCAWHTMTALTALLDALEAELLTAPSEEVPDDRRPAPHRPAGLAAAESIPPARSRRWAAGVLGAPWRRSLGSEAFAVECRGRRLSHDIRRWRGSSFLDLGEQPHL